MPTTDVLISGGGVAGASLAILLGRLGLRVELFERDAFPREKPCGEGLMPAGVAVLERMGLCKGICGAGFRGVRYHLGSQVYEGRFPSHGRIVAEGRGIRRRDLDQALFEAAATTRGVCAHAGTRVESAILDGGKVVGLRAGGREFRAPLVVAADGVRSPLRRQLGLDARIHRGRVGMRAHFQLAPRKTQPPWVEVFIGRGYELYVTPLPKNELLVAALTEPQILHNGSMATFSSRIQEHETLAERLSGARQITALKGAYPLAGRAHEGHAPGIVFLGDANGFIDPITGGGMTQALMTAELLAAYAARDVGNASGWLPEFESERKFLLRDYEMLTRAMLLLTQHRSFVPAVMGTISVFPGLLSHLVGIAAGMNRWNGKKPEPRIGTEPVTCRIHQKPYVVGS